MKKIILIISAMILILLSENIKAESFQVLDTPWKDSNGNNLPEYYGSYIQYPIATMNSGNYYSGVSLPNNAKGFYITFTMRNISAGSTYHCSQYDSTGQYCQEYRTDNQSYYAFTIVMGLNDYIGSCYFVDDSIPKADAKVERIKSMVYCPIPSNKSHVLNRVAINSYNALSNNSQVFYYIGLEKFLLVNIDGETTIIQNQQNTNEIINQTIEYSNETNTNTIGANETIQAGAMEDQLIQQNEFNGSIMDGMTIDSYASGFIWQIMERLRGMNIAIVTLMTMALGLGVIKLVLNR